MSVRTTTAGWFPQPAALRRARWQFAEGEIDEAGLRAVEVQATRETLKLQEQLGLDLLVAGQLERSDMVTYFGERLGGMELGGFVRCFGNRYYRRPRIVGEVAREGAITVDHWKTAAGMTSKPLRAIVTGPYTLMDWSFDERYGSREACCTALAEVIRQEVVELAEAGATEIEIAEPAIGARPEELPLAAKALDSVAADVRGRARVWTRIAYGQLRPVIDPILKLPADVLALEMTNSEFELLNALGDLPEDKQLGVGVVDVLDPEVETVEVIRRRIERVVERVPAERLWVMPDAGLRTLDATTVEAKLRNLVEAAGGL